MKKSTKEILEVKVTEQQVTEATQNQEQQVITQEPQETETQQDAHEDFDIEEAIESIDWSALKATKSKAVEKVSGEEGVCTIVNCKKNGNKRMSLASKVLDAIGNPDAVQVGIMPKGIAIAERLPIDANKFPIKKLGAKKVIYAGALVEEITEEFKLDYSNRTSITFQRVDYDNVDGYKVALITIQ